MRKAGQQAAGAPVHTAPLPSSAAASPLLLCPPMMTSSSLHRQRTRVTKWWMTDVPCSNQNTAKTLVKLAIGRKPQVGKECPGGSSRLTAATSQCQPGCAWAARPQRCAAGAAAWFKGGNEHKEGRPIGCR